MRVDLTGKVAIVTGSTAGVGLATVRTLAENGARVVVNGLSDRGEAVAAEIRAKGGEAAFERADIRVYGDIKAMVDRVLDRWGRVDIMVSSGGRAGGMPRPFLQTDPEEIAPQFSRALQRIFCARAVVEPMAQQKFGKIITIATDAGRWPTPSEALNGAASAGQIFFTRALAMELARVGVRVYTIAISLTKDTPGYEQYLELAATSDEVLGRVFRKIEERVPFGLSTAQDVANTALFLASDEANKISGATISVNGGMSFPG